MTLALCLALTVPLELRAQIGTDTVHRVEATVETEPVPSDGEAANDVCIWIHPADPALSTVILTDQDYCIQVCDLEGNQLHLFRDGRISNIDIRYNFPLGDEVIDLVCASDRIRETMRAYRVDPVTRGLVEITGTPIEPDDEPDGCALYRHDSTGSFYYFQTTRGDVLEQYELVDNGDGGVDATLVRSIDLGAEAEGLVADDQLGYIYVSIEDIELRRYDADPDGESTFTVLDTSGDPTSHIAAGIEGLTIYRDSEDNGYVIASSQGENQFVLFDRVDNTYVMTFRVVGGDEIDGASRTDGIDVSNVDFGADFPEGLFICQDGSNDPRQNFKLVPWDVVANEPDPPLTIDTDYDPRMVGGDESAPTAPTGVVAVAGEVAVEVSWDAATDDDSAILLYELRRDGVLLAYTTGLSYKDDSVGEGVEHSYTVVAYNASGVASEVSEADTTSADADETIPTLQEFQVGQGRDYLVLTFSEPISIDSVTADISDYWDPTLSVNGLALEPDGRTLYVECDFLYDESIYRFELTGVEDLHENSMEDLLFEFEFTLVEEVLDIELCCWVDDAEEEDGDGEVNLGSDDLELVEDYGNMAVALRYRGVPMGRGANVKTAEIQFTADDDTQGFQGFTIEAELVPDADYFKVQDLDLTSRARTEESVFWEPESWFEGDQDSRQRTANLADVVEEVLDLSTWRPGNAMVFLVTGAGRRRAFSYESDSELAPYLHLEYDRTETTYSELVEFRRGDVNFDQRVDVSDVVQVLYFVYRDQPLDCEDAADSDDSGEIEIEDVFAHLGYLFYGEGLPADGFASCGVDETVDILDCATDGC